MKEVLVKVVMNGTQINSVVKSRGFEDNIAMHLELAGLFQHLSNQELTKLGDTRSAVVQK